MYLEAYRNPNCFGIALRMSIHYSLIHYLIVLLCFHHLYINLSSHMHDIAMYRVSAPFIHDLYFPTVKIVSWKNVYEQIVNASIIVSILLILIGLVFK